MLRVPITSLACLSCMALAGCQQAERVADAGSRRARGWIGRVEPTGAVAETEVRTQTWEAIKQRFEEFDVEGLNAAVGKLSKAADLIHERLAALPPERVSTVSSEVTTALSALRRQMEQARIDQTSTSLRSLADELRAMVQDLPAEPAATLVDELTQLTRDTRTAIERLDQRLGKALGQLEQLTEESAQTVQALPSKDLSESIVKLHDATDKARRALEPIQESAAKWPAVTEQLRAGLGSLQLTLRVATAALVLLGVCAFVWLVRLLRPRPVRHGA